MDAGIGFSLQVIGSWSSRREIIKCAISGSSNGSSLVVISKEIKILVRSERGGIQTINVITRKLSVAALTGGTLMAIIGVWRYKLKEKRLLRLLSKLETLTCAEGRNQSFSRLMHSFFLVFINLVFSYFYI
ncbi:uncharacterized protein [Henckelia pumila]|uniref:uncharacterized protein isoform X1 n=1 Tax=Henckelia pumila TaxID=405737 RepID=UPI003C6DD94C